MSISKWPYFPAKASWMMIHNHQFSAFLFGLSELMKGRSGLRGQFRSTLVGSGKFYPWETKPEPNKDVLAAFVQLLLALLWCARLACGVKFEKLSDVGSSSTTLAESFKTGNKAEDLNYTDHGSSCQIFQCKLANHRSTVTSDAVAHKRAITRYKS